MTTETHIPAQVSHAKPQEEEVPSGPLAGDPAMVGVPTFLVGSIALGLTLIGYVPAEAVGAPVAIILIATGLGQLVAMVWAAALGQSAVASVFAVFTGFWISYAVLVLGLLHGWFAVPETAAVAAQELFLIAWLVAIGLLTLATLRLPLAFTVLFTLIEVAVAIVLAATISGSAALQTVGGIAVFVFVAVGIYIYLHAASVATGGKGLPLGAPVIH